MLLPPARRSDASGFSSIVRDTDWARLPRAPNSALPRMKQLAEGGPFVVWFSNCSPPLRNYVALSEYPLSHRLLGALRSRSAVRQGNDPALLCESDSGACVRTGSSRTQRPRHHGSWVTGGGTAYRGTAPQAVRPGNVSRPARRVDRRIG